MTTLTIFERIQNELRNMSDAKQKVGRYLLENWQETAFMSAAKLAREVGVSESVVVRFAQDLEFSGFPELQNAIQKVLRNRLTGYSSNIGDVIEPPVLSTKAPKDIKKVVDLTLQNLQGVIEGIQQETMLRVIELIIKSKRIIVSASRNAMGPAIILATHLNEIFTNTIFVSSGQDDVYDHLRSLTSEDLLITIGLPGYSKSTVRVAEFGHERSTPHVTITDSYNSPLAKVANIPLITYYNSYSYATSHVGTVFIIDILVYLITLKDNGKVLKSIEEIEVLNQKYGMYVT